MFVEPRGGRIYIKLILIITPIDSQSAAIATLNLKGKCRNGTQILVRNQMSFFNVLFMYIRKTKK